MQLLWKGILSIANSCSAQDSSFEGRYRFLFNHIGATALYNPVRRAVIRYPSGLQNRSD